MSVDATMKLSFYPSLKQYPDYIQGLFNSRYMQFCLVIVSYLGPKCALGLSLICRDRQQNLPVIYIDEFSLLLEKYFLTLANIEIPAIQMMYVWN